MNKKLLAAAVAAAVVAAPAAFAESTIYGKMHATIDALDYESGGAAAGANGNPRGEDNYEVNSRSSRIGFKGSEDLGGGLKAIYQIELSVNAGGGSDGQGSTSGLGGASRNTFVGLSGDWGTALVGRHDTPAKMAFYAAGNERLGDSVIDLNLGSNLTGTPNANQPIGVFHEYRADNVIAYVSPNFSGFTIVGTVIPGEDDKDTAGQTFGDSRDGIADHYSIGAMYKGNGLKASVGYTSYDLDPASTVATDGDDYEVLQVGASYTMNNFSFGAQYEDTDNMPDGFNTGVAQGAATAPYGNKGNDYKAWAVTGKYTFGNNAISAIYTKGEFDSDAAGPTSLDVDIGGWGLAAEHNFSKRTKVYAAYASGENEYDDVNRSDEDNDVFSLGMIHNF